MAVHRTRELLRIDRAVEDGIRVTAVARTLFDLAGVLTAQDLELAFEDALRRQLTSVARIRHRVDALGGRGVQGCSALRELVGAQRPGHRASGSKPEVGLRRLLVTTGYKPVSQFRVHRQGFEAFLDLAYPAVKLGIEYDGGPAHAGSLARARDRRRDHALAALGWRVVHVTKDELRNGAPTVLATVRAAFAASGS